MNVEQTVKQVISQHLGVKLEDLTLQTSLSKDLSVDSLDFVDLLQAINEEFGLNIRDEQIAKIDTVEELIQLIQKQRGGKR